MPPRRSFNPKRAICARVSLDVAEKAQGAEYVGNPLHKSNPGNFGLIPPRNPRPSKTLCDSIVTDRAIAQALLKEGVRKGLVSVQNRNGWPQNVWAVTDDGVALEAQLDNEVLGTYHGYPMTLADPLRPSVVARWSSVK